MQTVSQLEIELPRLMVVLQDVEVEVLKTPRKGDTLTV